MTVSDDIDQVYSSEELTIAFQPEVNHTYYTVPGWSLCKSKRYKVSTQSLLLYPFFRLQGEGSNNQILFPCQWTQVMLGQI